MKNKISSKDFRVTPIKFFLHLSQDEQRKRFLARIDEPDKNWKFSLADVHRLTIAGGDNGLRLTDSDSSAVLATAGRPG